MARLAGQCLATPLLTLNTSNGSLYQPPITDMRLFSNGRVVATTPKAGKLVGRFQTKIDWVADVKRAIKMRAFAGKSSLIPPGATMVTAEWVDPAFGPQTATTTYSDADRQPILAKLLSIAPSI
jgi:hypothetical protein